MYGTVADVAAAFDAAQWDPATHTPGTVTVTGWLTEWSGVLDGEIGHVVSVPVAADTSPNLYAVCEMITVLRVRAQVQEALLPSDAGMRQAETWRREAARLAAGIAAGKTADGSALGGRTPEAAGAPAASSFGTAFFTREQKL